MTAKKILVVDDQADTVAILRMMLEKAGYDVTSASNGLEGSHKAQEVLPDVILLDIMMPIMDGYTMNRLLKGNAKTERIPVIIVSARPPEKTPVMGTDPGMRIDGYMVKPFQKEALLMKIEEVFSTRR